MGKKTVIFWILLAASLFLSGCSLLTIDQMYKLPKRSDDYNNLQSAIDRAMAGMEYCAPLTGENRQTVHMADLDGDGDQEYLLFAKSNEESPLRILIFYAVGGQYVHTDTIESNGFAFEQVEYVQMDNSKGVEIVVGSQLSNQLLRSVSVYTFSNGKAEQLVSANYTKFLTEDMDKDGLRELFVLRPGQTDADNGVAELYGIENGIMERANQVNMSAPADNLKRILIGKLHDGKTAVYVASTADNTELLTDVYTYADGKLINVCISNEVDTGIKTMRNYYIYADDIDNDGVVELPSMLPPQPGDEMLGGVRQEIICWYAMKTDGTVVNKCYTYHNLAGGWYLEIDGLWASQATVIRHGNKYEFFIWDDSFAEVYPVFSIFVLTGYDRDEQSLIDNRFLLHKTDSVTYAAQINDPVSNFEITKESLVRAFHLIHHEWKTGEA